MNANVLLKLKVYVFYKMNYFYSKPQLLINLCSLSVILRENSNWKQYGKGIGIWIEIGVFIWSDGKKYEGYWKKENKNGEGYYNTAQEKMRSGLWENGRKIISWRFLFEKF